MANESIPTAQESQFCYCQSGKAFVQCCAPLLQGLKTATGPEELMRSRYTAFCRADGEYLWQTHAPETRGSLTAQQLADSAKESRWRGLKVIASNASGEHGEVEFLAFYLNDHGLAIHHEVSTFCRQEGIWLYQSAVFPKAKISLGRNEPCPCGSGRKYKRCCMTAK